MGDGVAIGRDALELSEIIGYKFSNISLLENALTHSSYTNEMRTKGIKALSNERLEFLGDAVLEIVISEYLYNYYSNYRDGALTKMRQGLVCEKTLAKIGSSIGLGEFINLGNGDEITECRKRPKVIADAFEALLGAVYLDCRSNGNDDYKGVILSLFKDEISMASNLRADYKTMLQQLAEQDGSALLEYKVINEDGPEHNKIFTVAALINNNVVGQGSAPTKKEAEMEAAKIALQLFGVVI